MALETITAEELVNTPLRSPGWVVEDLIGVGVTLLVGAPKVGKSWLVLRLAECVSRGEPLWGFATCGGTVLDLALEDNLPRIQQRLFRLADECSETFHLCVNAPSLADGLLDEVAAFVATHPGTKLVIVDTLQTVRQSSQKSAYASDYRDVRAFKGLADHFGIAVVLVHHQRKMDDPDPPQHRLGDERHHRRCRHDDGSRQEARGQAGGPQGDRARRRRARTRARVQRLPVGALRGPARRARGGAAGTARGA